MICYADIYILFSIYDLKKIFYKKVTRKNIVIIMNLKDYE